MPRLCRLRSILRDFFRRKRRDDDLASELDSHLAMLTEERIRAGASPADAAREARIRLGGLEGIKENCRDARTFPWLDDLWHDIGYAFRTLRNKPGFAAVAILTLGLGTGATTIMFTIVNSVLLKPLQYRDPDRLFTLHCETKQFGDVFGVTTFDFRDFKEQSKSLSSLTAWTFGRGTLSRPGQAAYMDVREISWDLFDVLGVPLTLGRTFTAQEDSPGGAPVAIIGERLWRERFGSSQRAIGSTIVMDGKPLTVVGVTPAGFQLEGDVDVISPLGQDTAPRMQNRDAYVLRVTARLKSGSSVTQAQAELELIGRQLAQQYPKNNAGRLYRLNPIRQDLIGDNQPTLLLLLVAVGLVLLVVCVNIASLLLARSISRERELAMRMALGARGSRLSRQCLTESALLGFCGTCLGIVIDWVGLKPFLLLWPSALPRTEEIRIDWQVLVFALALALLTSFLFGLAPALRAPARDLEQTLRAGSRSITGTSRRLHSAFVGTQIALAVVLLVSAGILGRTMLHFLSLDPGFNRSNVLEASVSISPEARTSAARIRANWDEFLDAARHVPGVQEASLSDMVPMRGGSNILSYWTSPVLPPTNQQPSVIAVCATNDYLTVMGIPLLRGRFFDEHDLLNSPPVVVIDEVLAQRAFKGADPVGKQLWIQAMNRAPVTVVGVVHHVRQWGLSGDDASQLHETVYYPFSQVPDVLLGFFSGLMSVEVRTAIPPLNVVDSLRHAVEGANADQVLYNIHTMEQLTSGSLARQRFLLLLFAVFAGLALLLASVGIYGVLAYLTSQRIPEIGVRMALGASAANVTQMVMRQSLTMVAAGSVVGLIAAVAAGRLLSQLVQGVQGLDSLTIVVTILVLFAAAIIASFAPARRASQVDPMNALRQE